MFQEEVETTILLAQRTSACSDTLSLLEAPKGGQLGSLGRRPGTCARLVSHSLCSLGPITGEAWQGSEEEASATAGSECSSVVGKFETWPG